MQSRVSMLSDENRRKEAAIASTLEENRRLHAEKQELAASNTALQRQIAELSVRHPRSTRWVRPCCPSGWAPACLCHWMSLVGPPAERHLSEWHCPAASPCISCAQMDITCSLRIPHDLSATGLMPRCSVASCMTLV